MDTVQTNQTDLVLQKTKEYENLPGLVLGLDGWILRSLPKELRSQFLNGYEKLLRIVFHPDRYPDPDRKESRQVYLQAVGEAVRFMLEDEFAFETISDTVPTRKNPMMTLRHAIEVRDQIINRLDNQIRQRVNNFTEYQEENSRIKMQLLRLKQQSDRRLNMDHRLRQTTRYVIKQFPVPIGFRFSLVSGAFLRLRMDSRFVELLGRYSSIHPIGDDNEWIRNSSWMDLVRNENLCLSELKLKLKRSVGRFIQLGETHSLTVIGAMTIAHLCHFIASRNDFQEQPLSLQQTFNSVQWLSNPINNDEEAEKFRMATAPYMLQYYTPGMLLVVQIRQQKIVRHELFMVNNVDAGDSPAKALASGFEKECNDLREKNLKQHLKISGLTKTVTQWKDEYEKLENKLEQMKKKLSLKHPWRNDRIGARSSSPSARAKAIAEVKKRRKQFAKH